MKYTTPATSVYLKIADRFLVQLSELSLNDDSLE